MSTDDVIEAMARAHHDMRFADLGLSFDALDARGQAEQVAFIRAALRAAEAMGWKVCPSEPTNEMANASLPVQNDINIWRAMWAAAPSLTGGDDASD